LTPTRLLSVLLPLLLAIPGAGQAPEAREQVVVLQARAQARQAYLLRVTPPGAPRAVAVLFPGSGGNLRLPTDGSLPQLNPRGNFLVRTRQLLCDADVAVALVDAPSDQPGGMDDAFRAGPRHLQDIAALLEDLRGRFPGARLFLVGTSRGTVSAAHLGAELTGPLGGVILTSTIFLRTRQEAGLGGFDFRTIKAPLLFVHHADDGCPVCPYYAAARQGERFRLITVRGGAPPESGPCDPLAPHGYFGKEAEVIAAIRGWILGRPFPARID
jgi:predicted esterase